MDNDARLMSFLAFLAGAVVLDALIGLSITGSNLFVHTQADGDLIWQPALFAIGVGGLGWTLLFNRRLAPTLLWALYAAYAAIAIPTAASFGPPLLLVPLLYLGAVAIVLYQATHLGRRGHGNATPQR